MRSSIQVTQREFDYSGDTTIMSTTDTRGRITYANSAFVQISGFRREELINQPHNLVRHPDVPRQAFADMWATLRAGRSWTGLVKNRRADGDHYWVRANATPMVRNGQVKGYLSVRTKPSRAEVAAVEPLYQAFREGRNGHLAFHQGLVVHTGWRRWMSWLQVKSVRWRLRVALLPVATLPVAAAAAVGSSGPHLAVTGAVSALSGLAAALFLEQQIAKPLSELQTIALSVAEGQACDRPPLNRVDEIGMIHRSINQAALNVRSLVDDVSEQVQGIQDISHELNVANEDLKARTESTAASLLETSASMEQMNASVKTSASTAQEASELARQASSAASNGGETVGKVVATMQDITHASQRIADIVSVVDGIAFQTNILALNAAVEAARAGEQGRGFAVVAAEVRSLAQRSAAAAKEIKTLIGASVEKVESGTQQVDLARVDMSHIVDQVRQVNDLMDAISVAAREQAGGIGQVNQAVSALDEMTQRNAALVQQSTSSAGTLRAQAQRLTESVNVYKS